MPAAGASGLSPGIDARSPAGGWAQLFRAAGGPLLFGLRLWASVCLALYVAFTLELDNPFWAGTSAAIVCQPQLGASLRKGWFRMVGTVIGAVAIVVMTACFPQQRALFLISLALWGALSALTATLLRNFASYAAALAGYTAAIIASDQLGATGGVNGDAFMLAVYRASEICIGIICAGIVLAGTDFGGATRRLGSLIAALSKEIVEGFLTTLAVAGAGFIDAQTVRRELTRRVIALDPVIDQALGEASQLRIYSPLLQRAIDGLLAALASWRTVGFLLARMPHDRARSDADSVLVLMPDAFRPDGRKSDPNSWITGPSELRQDCQATAQQLIALPADTPSLRLMADRTAELLAGLSDALDGLALLVAAPVSRVRRRAGVRRPRVPDWLPALVNAARAFVTIGAVALFWIVTAWPGGAFAITFAAIGTTLLAPRADQAYAAAVSFMTGTVLTTVFAAIIGFAVLPGLEGFAAFSLAIGLVLVPAGAGMAQPRWTVAFMAMAANFIPLLAPANLMSYDTVQFYNNALAILVGLGTTALAFRLLPPLPPAYRTRRLLMLTLRDLHRLIKRGTPRHADDWNSRGFGRLLGLPDAATPLQRSQLLAALSVGFEIIELRRTALRLGLSTDLDAPLRALAQGNIAIALAGLTRLDSTLVHLSAALPARSHILAITELLTQHGAYFEAGASR